MKLKGSQARKNRPHRLWILSSIFTLVILNVLITASLVRHALLNGSWLSKSQAAVVIAVAEFPSLVKKSILTLFYEYADQKSPLIVAKKDLDQGYSIISFPSREDKGYLLFSGVSKRYNQSVVQLIRIADGNLIAEWVPDWNYIYSRQSEKKHGPKGRRSDLRSIHPVLLENGDIIFNTGDVMARVSLCESHSVWVLDAIAHHSNELDLDGNSILVSGVSDEYFSSNDFLKENLRDDSIMRVSLDGKVLENRSFSKILIENGLEALLLGTSGQFNADPIHMNQISVAPFNTKFWRKGDLLISARHLSSLFIYRPSTGKIIWHQQGPWMNQHSAIFFNDHQISVFNNNVMAGNLPKGQEFLNPQDNNQVIIYDFKTKKTSQPFRKMLDELKPKTITEGRAQVLPDGGLFVEESNYGRQLRFTKEKLLWSRVNEYNEDYIGILSWSRYISENEVRKPLNAILRHSCK